MSSTSWPSFRLSFLFILVLISFIFCSSSTVEAQVPKSKTYKYVNQGDTGYPEMEYGHGVRATDIYTNPFQLMFYGISGSDGLYTLGIAMVTTRFQSLGYKFRWVWAANRGNPVHENATLTFGTNGNLVLAEANGKVVWQTGTANKGVVDLKLLPNGNLVLLNKNGGFVWQSFDHPTDTLLVGQSLISGGKLVSRNEENGSFGPYSLVAEKRSLNFYYKNSKNAASKPLLYDGISVMETVPEDPKSVRVLKNVTFNHFHTSATKEGRHFSDLLRLEFFNDINKWGSSNLAQQKYNSTYSFLRLESDGSVNVYTLYDVETFFVPGEDFTPWEVTYTYKTTMCQLPEKCGSFGLCENNECSACPTPNGLTTPWNETCMPPKLPSCNIKKGPSSPINYYKMVGVNHFLNRYQEGEGPIKVGQCKKKCSKDCNCVAAFFNKDTLKCLLISQISTLIKSGDPSHLAFIKYQK